MIVDCEQSQWSLSSVQVPAQKVVEEQQSSFAHTTLHQQYSYQSKHPPERKPIILKDAPLHSVGKVMSVVEDFVVIDSLGTKVVDLETYLLNKDKQIVGYIVDVLGQIDHHYYAMKQEQNHVTVGEELFYVEGCRILEKQDINKLKNSQVVKDDENSDDEDEEVVKPTFKKRDRSPDNEPNNKYGRKMKLPNPRDNKPQYQKQQYNSYHYQQQWQAQQPQFQPQAMFQNQSQYNPQNMFFAQSNHPQNQFGNNSLFPNSYHMPNIHPNPNLNTNQIHQNMHNIPVTFISSQIPYSNNNNFNSPMALQSFFSQTPENLRQYQQNSFQQSSQNQKK